MIGVQLPSRMFNEVDDVVMVVLDELFVALQVHVHTVLYMDGMISNNSLSAI